jgi:ferredoxin
MIEAGRTSTPSARAAKPLPQLEPRYCKGCGRCIDACPKHAIDYRDRPDAETGFIPVEIDLESCNACGLCLDACPEPWGLQGVVPRPEGVEPFELPEPRVRPQAAADLPDEFLPLAERQPLAIKGTHAAAVGALLAGCRHFYGYPITPSTEGAELMARLLPGLGGSTSRRSPRWRRSTTSTAPPAPASAR